MAIMAVPLHRLANRPINSSTIVIQSYRALSSSTSKSDSEKNPKSHPKKPAEKATHDASLDTLQPPASSPSHPHSQEASAFDRLTNLYNESSGTTELSHLKEAVSHASRKFDTAVRNLQTNRYNVELATSKHDEANRKHATLLMRREQWDGEDALKFAELTGAEVTARRELKAAREALQKAEDEVSSCQVEYIDAMRRRYHEEQIWQDRWRVLGTYGTWGLIGLNSVIFLGSQLFHWRRETGRLKRIEDLIRESNNSIVGTVASPAVVEDDLATKTSSTIDTEETEIINSVDSSSSSSEVLAAEATLIEQTEDAQTEEDQLVYNEITCPSDTESNEAMASMKNSQVAKKVRGWVKNISSRARGMGGEQRDNDNTTQEESTGTKSTLKDKVGGTTAALSSTITKGFEEIHWPSSAVGAVASAAGILLLSLMSSSRR